MVIFQLIILGGIFFTIWWVLQEKKKPRYDKFSIIIRSDSLEPINDTLNVPMPLALTPCTSACPEIVKIKSYRDDSIEYQVNTDTITCNCLDFVNSRASYPVNSPQRCCKHIVDAFDMTNTVPPQLAYYWGNIDFLRRGDTYRMKIGTKRLAGAIGNKPIVLYLLNWQKLDAEEAWLDVFYVGWRHGYNPHKDLWTHSARDLEEFTDIALWTYDKIGIQLPEPIKEGSIETTARNGTDVRGRILNGFFIEATIKPKASWMPFNINSWSGRINIRTGEAEFPIQCINIENAIASWIHSEYQFSRKETAAVKSVQLTKKRTINTTSEELDAYGLICGLIEDVLPKDTKVVYKDTISYFIIKLDNSRKWICRLNLESKNKSIEFPDGTKEPLFFLHDLAKHKTKLVQAAQVSINQSP